ncbi:Rhodopsin domain-containing protein [Madurella fahalii]|uniref:Rhodopsin domain-containing protein n=1 Tax=Madurella fahalii TaxID=1157608 RepID=A0ABQ0GJ49_9PEZI
MSSAAPAPGDGLAAPNGTMPLNGTVPLIPLGIPVSDNAAYLAQVFIGVTSTLMALCIITFGTRIYQRVVPVWKVGLDDYFIVAGFILTVADWAMLFPQMVPTPGLIPIERGVQAGKHSWLAIPIWGLSMTCIKISIALTLLRIQGNHRSWRIFLYTVIGVQAIYGIGNTIFDLAIACQPLAAAWDMTVQMQGGRCVSTEVMRGVSNLGSSINITTDVLLSLAPATFLRKLNRPLRERVFVCVLMGMGLFASCSSIVKTVIIKDWGDPFAPVDFWAMGVSICTWTALEQLLGVLAACVPAMKGTFQRCLGAVGVSLTESRSQQRSGYYARNRSGTGAGGASAGAGDLTASGTLRSQKGQSDVLRSAQRFSRGGILKEQTIVVEYDEEVCIDLPEVRRNSAAKSSVGSSGSQSPGEPRGRWVEHLPAHAV